jgi:hypothetical protein
LTRQTKLPLRAYDGNPPAQKHSDTSVEAGARIDSQLNRLQRQVLNYLQKQGETGATDEEMQQGLGMPPNTQRPRRRELQLNEVVHDSGARRLTRSGRRAVVWKYRAG